MASPLSASDQSPSRSKRVMAQTTQQQHQRQQNDRLSSHVSTSEQDGRELSSKEQEAGADKDDLARSLKHLTISTNTTSPGGRQPRSSSRPVALNPLKLTNTTATAGAVDRSPSSCSPRRPSSAMRSPLAGGPGSSTTPSRSGTPTLLRKASMNSLHSANGVTPLRRASSAGNLSPSRSRSGKSPLRSMSPESPEKPIYTPQSVANAHFKAELEALHSRDLTRRADTVVILQDACYGHRYSRPRASKGHLSTIVERPERVKACVMGVSAAYVRLGERHQDGEFPIAPDSDPASLPSIPFRIQKSDRRLPITSQTVTNVHGTKWMEELKIMCETAESKLAVGGKELQRPDIDRGANAEPPQKFHEGDLYLCSETLEALEGALGGVCDAVDAVFRPHGPQRAFVAIRPPGHHCSASHPSGFCWINNVHVGIMHAVLSHGLTHAAIIDFDLHHGDGSQSIAWQHNARSTGLGKNAAWWKKSSIGYFSLHDINSYPCEMGDEEKVRNASICIDNAHGQSIWNVHLQPWKTEADFWALYETRYSILLEKTREYLRGHTERLRSQGLNSKAAIFLSAGFDASEWESAGMQRHNVNVPTEFYARLTRDVVKLAAEEGTSVEGRVISVLEGGYSDRALCSGVLSHICGLAGDGPSHKEADPSGLGYEMGQKMGSVQRQPRKDSSASERGVRRYESSWWSAAHLEELESAIMTPPIEYKKPRNCIPPTYSSPTHASTARSVIRRSVSGQPTTPISAHGHYRAPTPPPPDVSWTTAAIELSKLLVPAGRQTSSHTAEDLNAEASRARRERHIALTQGEPVPTIEAPTVVVERAPTRMSLRERKAKPSYLDEDEEDHKSRRKTVAGTTALATEKKQQRQPARRLSAASTLVSDSSEPLPPLPTPVPKLEPGRPDSAMSVRTTNGSSINVKKTRAPAVKKEPVPRGPRVLKKTTVQPGGPTGPGMARSVGASPVDKNSGGDDAEKLAQDMKKIKITVISKAQREARERERLAKENAANADTVVVSTPPLPAENNKPPSSLSVQLPAVSPTETDSALVAPRSADGIPEQQRLPSSPPGSTPLASPSGYGHGHPHGYHPPLTPSTLSMPASSSPAPSSPMRAGTPMVSSTLNMDMFIQYQPEGPDATTLPLPQQQPLQWLPPNTSSSGNGGSVPVSPMRRGDLPVFSSTGVIPFSSPSPVRSVHTLDKKVKKEENPESPHY
ncbi:hypothetical protein QBC35DRAFT_469740 [Podospora australis]|uniref:Histone deacetylase domain-containing protein n=1 Tax=Podospora australis TaxID=1536484 RepID=A0AAN7AP16_9PEZI|nr:hypothetical protein QBC35DRAFT_469740 [Podospora australis]